MHLQKPGSNVVCFSNTVLLRQQLSYDVGSDAKIWERMHRRFSVQGRSSTPFNIKY